MRVCREVLRGRQQVFEPNDEWTRLDGAAAPEEEGVGWCVARSGAVSGTGVLESPGNRKRRPVPRGVERTLRAVGVRPQGVERTDSGPFRPLGTVPGRAVTPRYPGPGRVACYTAPGVHF